jgi:signal transduction histidine kinase
VDTFAPTLIALAAPRRSVPIALCIATLAAVQLYYGGARSAIVPAAMAVGFVVLAPWAWRVLLAHNADALRVVAYVALATAIVATCGVALPHALAVGPTFLTDAGSLAVAEVLFLVGGWGLGRDIELEQDLEHLRLKAIRTHLDPHFLYNALNAIAEWCREDPKVAEEATLRLAELLRATLEALDHRRWPIAREVAVVKDLLELHRIRDPNAFTVELMIDPAIDHELPPLVLVGIVENALKHGPRNGHRGTITIAVHSHNSGIRCEIANPGPFAPSPDRVGHGLATLRARLSLTYGRRATFTIGADGADRTRAVLEVAA